VWTDDRAPFRRRMLTAARQPVELRNALRYSARSAINHPAPGIS
jgi:hypothetical protein